jgi:hypothetical protein
MELKVHNKLKKSRKSLIKYHLHLSILLTIYKAKRVFPSNHLVKQKKNLSSKFHNHYWKKTNHVIIFRIKMKLKILNSF